MKRKAKLPFDPKVFLSKVNGGQRISDYRKIKLSLGRAILRIPFSTFRAVRSKRPSFPSRARKPWSHFWGWRFLRRRLLDWRGVAAVDGRRSDEMCDRANIKGRHHARDPRRAGVCRVVYRAPPGPQQSCRRGSGRSTVQFERETSGADSSASGEFWQGKSAGADHSKGQPGDACGDDWNDPVPRKFFHEQISQAGLD